MANKDFLNPVAEQNIPGQEPEVPGDYNSVAGFLDYYNTSNKLNSSGWQIDPLNPEGKGGKPQTFETQQFVLDYLNQYGMRPSAQRIGRWESAQDTGQFTYDPESTMGKLGWENLDQSLDWRSGRGGPFGPLAGSFVPQEAGVVITDETGNPIGRFDPSSGVARTAMAEGRFITPPEMRGKWQPAGEPFGFDQNDVSRYYNQPLRQMSDLNQQQLIEQYGTPQAYLEGLSGYLDSLVYQNRPRVEDIYNQIKERNQEIDQYQERYEQHVAELQQAIMRGEMSTEVGNQKAQEAANIANSLIANTENELMKLQDALDSGELWTEERSQREYAKARDAIGQGVGLADLPFFSEVSPTIAARGLEEQRKQRGIEEKNQPAPFTGFPQQERPEEQQDFLAYVNSLGLTPEFERWLLGQYGNLKGLWQQSGDPEFLPWLNNYLAGGG